jgi:hypothetical protein
MLEAIHEKTEIINDPVISSAIIAMGLTEIFIH